MKNKRTYLITTPIEEKYISNKNKKLYLSDWFPKNLKKKKNYDILNNRWDSIKCKNNDFKLIKKTFYIHLNFLSAYLAKYHNLNYSKSFYKHIIFVWLLHYISFQYFRWSSIKEVLKKKKIFFFLDINFKEASFDIKDTLDFVDLAFESDLFNYITFKRVIYNFKNSKNLKIVNYKNSIQLPKKNISNFQLFRSSFYKKRILISLLNFYEKIMFIFTKNNKIFFIDVVCSKFFLKLNLYLNQFPNIFYNKFAWNIIKKHLYENTKINSYNKSQLLFKKKKLYKTNSKNKFDFFISKHIISDIPYCFLEGFKTLDNETKKINLNPKIIFTSISHFYNEFFKIWAFKRKLNKESLLVVLRHGGIHHKYQDLFSFYERFISSKYISFVKKYFSKSTISLPSIKYFYLNKNCRCIKNLKELCYVSYEFRTYPVRLGVGPSSFKSHLAIEDFKTIYSNLNLDIRNNFSFLPNNTFHDVYNKQLLSFLPKEKILENSSLKRNIKRFKLIICSYPLTAFIDSMITGPTILVYNPKWWTPMNEFKKDYYLMKKNKIIFENAKEAAEHINLNWENLDTWWLNKETKKARENFLNKFNISGKKSYFEYKNFFDNLLSKKV